MELTKENICEYLLHLGFDKCEILSIRNVRNFCAKVSTNKGNILVKQKGSNRSTFADVSMYNELLFYKLITKGVLFTDNQSITPKVLNIDEEFEIVTIDFLDDYKNLSIEDNTENYQLSYELGKQVASIHNVSTELCNGFTIAKTENYFRTFDIVTPEMFNAGGPLFAKCVELMQRYPDLNEGIESFRKEFCWDCLIHGDLKPDNILFKITNEKQYVKFIDWELTGLGDRYLDLGYVVGGYLLWWIENMKFGNDLDVNNERMAIVREHIYYFIMGYQNTLADKFKLDYIKLSHFTSIFLLNIFHSKSFFKSQYSKQDIMILETARKMLINSEIVYRELFMKLIMQSYEKLFDDLGKAFLYKRNVGLSHYNGELVVNSSELMDIKKATRQITDFIYKTYYSKQGSLSKGKLFDEITIETDDSFLMKLSTIYSEKMQESNNWIVIEKISEHNFKVFKQDITLTIDKNIHLPINERTINLRKGDVITILFSCHFPNISHGFYVFKSDMGEIDISLGIGRLYFNLNFEYAVDFSKGLLSLLYSNKLKFDYKIFKNLRTQYRVDSAVLYFSLNDYNQILKLIMPFIFSNPQMFNDEVSVFHNTVAKGVGFAEEPIEKHEHESYGLNRCRIIAETIYDSLNVIESTRIIPFENFEKKFMQKKY